MGACSSCLGRRDKGAYDDDEENRLLYDDAHGGQYGSFGDSHVQGDQDTVETQRENEALQRIVAKTSNNMVDIFEIAPGESSSSRHGSSNFAYTGHGPRVARYQHLLSKLNSKEDDGTTAGVKVDWLGEDDAIEPQDGALTNIPKPKNDDSPLVGTFADAAAAMK